MWRRLVYVRVVMHKSFSIRARHAAAALFCQEFFLRLRIVLMSAALGPQSRVGNISFVVRALPTETNVESGTSQSKSGTPVNSSNSGLQTQLLRGNVVRFPGGLVFRAHSFLYHSTEDSRVRTKNMTADRMRAQADPHMGRINDKGRGGRGGRKGRGGRIKSGCGPKRTRCVCERERLREKERETKCVCVRAKTHPKTRAPPTKRLVRPVIWIRICPY
jgi:hypothetical protein